MQGTHMFLPKVIKQQFFFFFFFIWTVQKKKVEAMMMTIWPAGGCDKKATFLTRTTGSEPGAIARIDLCFCALNLFAVPKEIYSGQQGFWLVHSERQFPAVSKLNLAFQVPSWCYSAIFQVLMFSQWIKQRGFNRGGMTTFTICPPNKPTHTHTHLVVRWYIALQCVWKFERCTTPLPRRWSQNQAG